MVGAIPQKPLVRPAGRRPGDLMIDFAQARRNMVDSQLRTFDVTDRALLAAMAEVPRELFVPPDQQSLAYSDRSIELPGKRWLLAPMVLARLIQALSVEAGRRVLDVGGGGYSAAVLARLGADVTRLEKALDEPARAELGADGTGPSNQPPARYGRLDAGCPDLAPFDAILVHGAVEARPAGLLEQLTDRGRLACLGREGGAGRAFLYVKNGEAISFRSLFDSAAPWLPDFAEPRGFVF